jgi:threonine/homoserine/homoserine lactone efflux protein
MMHVVIAVVTLGVSAFVAFGPLRHRLPRFITRLARYSMALKLCTMAGFCGFLLWHNVRDQGPMSGRWALTGVAVLLVAAGIRVLFIQPGVPPV